MSSSFSKSQSLSKPNVNENEWVENTRRFFEHEHEHEHEEGTAPVSIFTVPKVLLDTDPESYIPQQISIGPFHHWRPELYDMQRYKLLAAKRFTKKWNINFHVIAEGAKLSDTRVRASYQKYLDMNADTLGWIMALDVAFLLEFLQVYHTREEDRVFKRVDSGMSHVVDASRKKLSHTTILRDLVMVENQVPLFFMKNLLFYQVGEDDKVTEETLKTMLMGLYHKLSPFQEQKSPNVVTDDCDHLLDFFYHLTVPNEKELGIETDQTHEIDIEQGGMTEAKGGGQGEDSFMNPSYCRKLMNYIWKILSKSDAVLVRFSKKIIFSKPFTVLTKLPWKIISKLLLLSPLKEPIENMLESFQGKEEEKIEDGKSEWKSPLIEEISIPSVTQMAKAGIRLAPVCGGIASISFDKGTCTLYLPVVSLDLNSGVYLRNLVAYEACVASGPLVVARYTELMNGIIDTEEDVQYLSEKGIVLNHLKSNKEVADLWNGMCKAVKLTRVPKMDNVIDELNMRYKQHWRVQLARFTRTYMFGSWKFLTLLAALSLLFLMTIQAFCSVYACASVFRSLPDVGGGDGSGD